MFPLDDVIMLKFRSSRSREFYGFTCLHVMKLDTHRNNSNASRARISNDNIILYDNFSFCYGYDFRFSYPSLWYGIANFLYITTHYK